MTAEVCLMNTLGVALATDSAVTLGGAHSPKIYNSADKLFLLSERAAVGAMIFGNAALMEVPWETLIKSYRRQSNERLESVKAYGDDFLKFLSSERQFFPPSVQERAATKHAHVVFDQILRAVHGRLEAHIKASGALTQPQALRYLRAEIRLESARWLKEASAADLLQPTIGAGSLRRLYGPVIDEAINRTFAKLRLDSRSTTTLRSCVIEELRRERFSAQATGLVIAGFGREEFFPSMVELVIDDVIAGRPRWKLRQHKSVSHDHTALVLAFAQREMVYAFMEGIDHRLERLIETTIEKLFLAMPTVGIEGISGVPADHLSTVKSHLESYVTTMLPKLWNEVRRYRRHEYANPVASIVAHLPKDELGSMAEALVNLTSFRRRVTADAETVGGPIDVAVITRGDGFVWLRRKHYFPADLNPRHMAQHYRRSDV